MFLSKDCFGMNYISLNCFYYLVQNAIIDAENIKAW